MTQTATLGVNRYTASEGQLVFPYTFKVLDADHMTVFVGDTQQSSGFSVSGVGDDSGGNVTFTAAAVPRDTGEAAVTVTLKRAVPYDQVVDLPSQGAISSVSLEESGLDRIVQQIQQLSEVDERSLKVPVSSSLSDSDTEVTPAAGALIGFNAGGTALATYAQSVLTSSIVPTTLMETLLGDATIAAALATLGLTGLSPAAADAGKLALVDAAQSFAFVDPPMHRNLLANGDFSLMQRMASQIATLGSATAYTLDMWQLTAAGSAQGRATFTQDTTEVPDGHAFAMKIDCTTAEAAVGAAELLAIGQRIEANRLQHLLYGAAGAVTLTCSFSIRSPKSGTHCVALVQPDGTRSYVREFTVDAADTWQRISVTFPGDASGTINNDTGTGLHLVFPLVAGSDYQATADAWAAGTDYATANQQNLLDNTANNLYLAGVQLEVGSVATAFERLPLPVTRALCERYFEQWNAEGDEYYPGIGQCVSATGAQFVIKYAQKRATPSLSFATATRFDIHAAGGTDIEVTAITATNIGLGTARVDTTVAAGLTAGHATQLRDDSGGVSYISISAELTA